jgi:hypothetical protein
VTGARDLYHENQYNMLRIEIISVYYAEVVIGLGRECGKPEK